MFISGVAEGDAQGEVAEYFKAQREMWGFLPAIALWWARAGALMLLELHPLLTRAA